MTLYLTIIFGALGALIGSFAGVVAERIYTGQSWKRGRSRCNSCRELLTARDLIPVFSWVLHKGKCRRCGSKVPGAYAVYEVTLAVIFAAAYLRFGLTLPLVPFLLAITVLGFITIYDIRHTIVPPAASAVFIVFAALFRLSLSLHAFPLQTIVYTAGIGLFFFLLYALSRGRAMGLGDTPIAIGLSLLAGNMAIAGFLYSFWIGGVIGIGILVFRKGGPTMGIEVPFVPFMALGFLLALLTQWNPLPF